MTPHHPHSATQTAGATARLARALGALVMLAGVVAGVPALMAALHLVPHAVPGWGQVSSALTQRDTGQLVVVILAAAIWICWALFTVSLITEILAAIRRRPARLLPGLAVFQRPAGALVAAIMIGLLVAPSVGGAAAPLTVAASAAPTRTLDTVQHDSALQPTAGGSIGSVRGAREAAGPTYVVQPRDTLWGIAERSMGNPLRYTEIVTLNPGRIGPDNEITPGTRLTLPTDATTPHSTTADHNTTAHGTAGPDTADHTAGGVRVTVHDGDTLSGITERVTGDANLYPEVAVANHIPDPDAITPGQVITIPAHLIATVDTEASAGASVTVRPGDTLAGLTQGATGHADEWPAVWRANQGRPEPGGASFDDPDLIYPGWTITIPAPTRHTDPAATDTDPAQAYPKPATSGGGTRQSPGTPSVTTPATGADTIGSAHTAPTSSSPAASPTTNAPARRTAPPAAQTSPGHPADTTSQAAHTPATAVPPETGPAVSADPDAGAVAAPPAAAGQRDTADEWVQVATFTAGGGVLLAGLTLAALRGYRRGQFRRRRPGRMIATAPTAGPVERAVLAAGPAGIVDVTFLDRALRALVHTAPDRDGRMPDVIAACLSGDRLTLVLATPDDRPPAGWHAEDDGARWSIGRDDDPGFRDQRRDFDLAPYPTLVSVGHTDAGQQWLLDLERAGSLTLSGDPERTVNLARFIAAELAHNTWSEMLTITMVGFGAELVAANPDRLTHTADLTAAVDAAARLDRLACDGVLAGRAGPQADEWSPHVLLVADPDPDTSGLDDLRTVIAGRSDRGRVALVVARNVSTAAGESTGWELTIDPDGTMTIPALGVRVSAEQVPADEAAQLAQMLAVAADADDTRYRAAPGPEPWETDSDTAGALTVTAGPRPTGTRPGLHVADTDDQTDSVLPLPDHAYLEAAAVQADELDLIAPTVDQQIREQAHAADPDLDRDLADWNDPRCLRPRITVLGAPTVRAAGTLPTRSPQQRANTEAVVYLATRGPDGVTSTVFAETMWPGDRTVVGKSKVSNMVWALRGWLGQNPDTGRDYLPDGRRDPGPARYRIDGALVDAHLFRRLRKRGMARGAEGIADLETALTLVAGPPFDGITERRTGDDPGPGGWLWLTQTNSRLDLEYTGMIVDTAHTVATHHLAEGRPVQAADILRIGLNAGGYDDILLLDLIAACQAQGLTGEAAAYEAQLHANYDGADLPERTEQILRRIHARYRDEDRRLIAG